MADQAITPTLHRYAGRYPPRGPSAPWGGPAVPERLTRSLWSRLSMIVRTAQDPHAELLALVWGSRFDREHAQGLLHAIAAMADDNAVALLTTAANTFDQLAPQRQQRLRRLIVRHRAGWDNRRHGPHSAD